MRPNDERVGQVLTELATDGSFRCPVYACHLGPDANVYTATVRAPNGRQRTVFACVEHLGLEVSRALSAIRLEPFA